MNRRTFLAALAALVGWKAKPVQTIPIPSEEQRIAKAFIETCRLMTKIDRIARDHDRLAEQPIGPTRVWNFDEYGKLIRRRA